MCLLMVSSEHPDVLRISAGANQFEVNGFITSPERHPHMHHLAAPLTTNPRVTVSPETDGAGSLARKSSGGITIGLSVVQAVHPVTDARRSRPDV